MQSYSPVRCVSGSPVISVVIKCGFQHCGFWMWFNCAGDDNCVLSRRHLCAVK